ncbi:MAG: 50S ribosomal protein L1 [Candidatus Poribacteria bacterium]|nr:50S ribosomal protein L1 [Candidatus Poribacteria bacterium]
MKQRGKRYRDSGKLVDRLKLYDLDEGLQLLKKTASAKFDETVDLAVHLGVDPRHADQNIRGTVSLPHGTGKEMRVVVFAQGDKAREAEEAGADAVGTDDLVEKIVGGWLDFDATIATPDLMRTIMPKLGRILGPRGLMPNAKAGTVTMDVEETVRSIKAGQIEYRVEKQSGVVHVLVGKASFDDYQIKENIETMMSALVRARPASTKGRYLKNITVSSTMGAGIRLEPQQFG